MTDTPLPPGERAGAKGSPRAPITIRPARLADATALARLSAELGYPSRGGEIETRLEQLLGREEEAVLVAETGAGETVGWVHVFSAFRLESPAFAELGGLVVAEGCRGRGWGRTLVEAAERWALARGLDRMRVRSNVVRERAHSFYLGLGFLESKRQAVFERELEGEARSRELHSRLLDE